MAKELGKLRGPLKVAVVGATGAVGKKLLHLLEQRKFPVGELIAFASPRSVGKLISYGGRPIACRALEFGCFEGVDLAFFDASDAVSKEWVPHAVASGAWVVDNSATFRLDSDILLIVPEVNGAGLIEAIRARSPLASRRIVTGPNCVAVPLAVALHPIHQAWGIRRIVVSSYQSTSGAGAVAMQELATQTQDVLDAKAVHAQVFPHQIAFNCIPHIGKFQSDGSTSEEQKMIAECQKILGTPDLKIAATAVRVPSFSCHAMAVNIECKKAFGSVEDVWKVLQAQDGLLLQDAVDQSIYPLGVVAAGDLLQAATDSDAVHVGRVRRDVTLESGLNLWIVSDNLRKGAALNAVQVAEVLLTALG